MRTTRLPMFISSAVAVSIALTACGGSDSGGSDADVCGRLQAVADVLEIEATNEEEGRDAIERFAAALEDFADVAPSEIKDDAEKLADGTKILAGADFDDPSEEAQEILADETYDESGDAVEAFALETCDIKLDG